MATVTNVDRESTAPVYNGGEWHAMMTHAEIAAVLGTTEQNIQMTERRALAKLRVMLERMGWESSEG